MPVPTWARLHGRARDIALVFVASVWLVHGVYNKLLGGSPRHLAIVQSVPGFHGAVGELVISGVGLFETALAVWILSGWAAHACAAVQTAALLSMNVVELAVARDLLISPAGLIPVNVAFLAIAWMVAGPLGGAPLRARLRRHPFAVDARLEDCLTLTYTVPAATLRPLLPPGLELDTHNGDGFVAVALVKTRSLRPAAVPAIAGQDFVLAGYRVFTRFSTADGRRMRGLRILRSDADRRLMVMAGNLLTHYNYHRCRARLRREDGRLHVVVRTFDGRGDVDVTADLGDGRLPEGSPFESVREARRFAGPLPFTFDYERETNAIIAINARRTNWKPRPVAVRVGRLAFFDDPVFVGCRPRLAAAFYVDDVDYRWQRGVRYPLMPRAEGV
jgi:uncharacterized protein YqjF (DUF2071 family)